MKTVFREFYNAKFSDWDEILEHPKTLYVFDTNVLLSLYETHTNTTEMLLKSIELIKGQTWMPYQIGLEFQHNRLSTLNKSNDAISEKIKKVKEAYNILQAIVNDQYVKPKDTNNNVFIGQLNDLNDALNAELNRRKQEIKEYLNNDPVLERLENIFVDKRIGLFFTEKEIISIKDLAEKQWKQGCGIGHEDRSKQGVTHYPNDVWLEDKYGDFVYVEEIKRYILQQNMTESQIEYLVLVSNDNKKDFWHKVNSDKKVPQPSFKKDILDVTKIKDFLFLDSHDFLKKFKDKVTGFSDVQKQEALDNAKSLINNKFLSTNTYKQISNNLRMKEIQLELKDNFNNKYKELIDILEDSVDFDEFKAKAGFAEYTRDEINLFCKDFEDLFGEKVEDNLFWRRFELQGIPD